jgi:hypothetical protein
MAYKGYFTPKNFTKYKGNPSKIVFRSLWERKIMQWCDQDNSVLEWASEEISIPYYCPTDNKRHKYYPDFYIKTINNGKIKEQIVEVKPKKQTKPPKFKSNTRKKTMITESKAWTKNSAKWKAANEYCKIKNWEFHIITENHPLLRMYKK